MLTDREKELMLYAARAGYHAGLCRKGTNDEALIKEAADFYVKKHPSSPPNNDNEQDGA